MATVRDRTEQGVLDMFFSELGPLTRVEIAHRAGLSKPTVNAAVRRLETEGLLAPSGTRTGRQGRVATYYEIADGAGSVVAVELSPGVIRVASGDLVGRQLLEQTLAPPERPSGVEEALRSILSQARASPSPLRAMAVAVANPVDQRTRSVVELADTPYPEGLVQPVEILAPVLGDALVVDNDVNLAALAEMRSGAAQGIEDFVYLYVGAGLGMGVVVGGQLVRGSRGLAGEIGYFPSRASATAHHGLARAVSGYGLARPAGAAGPAGVVAAARELLARADDGDSLAQAAAEDAGRALGEAVAAVCAVLDPELVVVGGPIGLHPMLLGAIQLTVAELVPAPTPVVAGELGESAPLQGALELARRHARARL